MSIRQAALERIGRLHSNKQSLSPTSEHRLKSYYERQLARKNSHKLSTRRLDAYSGLCAEAELGCAVSSTDYILEGLQDILNARRGDGGARISNVRLTHVCRVAFSAMMMTTNEGRPNIPESACTYAIQLITTTKHGLRFALYFDTSS